MFGKISKRGFFAKRKKNNDCWLNAVKRYREQTRQHAPPDQVIVYPTSVDLREVSGKYILYTNCALKNDTRPGDSNNIILPIKTFLETTGTDFFARHIFPRIRRICLDSEPKGLFLQAALEDLAWRISLYIFTVAIRKAACTDILVDRQGRITIAHSFSSSLPGIRIDVGNLMRELRHHLEHACCREPLAARLECRATDDDALSVSITLPVHPDADNRQTADLFDAVTKPLLSTKTIVGPLL